jgi:hypothetical protein
VTYARIIRGEAVHNDGRALYHYTIFDRLALIQYDRLVIPAHEYVAPPELPIVWFSATTSLEPTARKMVAVSAREVRKATDSEMLAAGLCRFTVNTPNLSPWPELAKLAHMSSATARALESAARDQGAEPLDWYGGTEQIDVRQIVRVERAHSIERWCDITAQFRLGDLMA